MVALTSRDVPVVTSPEVRSIVYGWGRKLLVLNSIMSCDPNEKLLVSVSALFVMVLMVNPCSDLALRYSAHHVCAKR